MNALPAECLHLRTVAAADMEGSYELCLNCGTAFEVEYDGQAQRDFRADRELDCRREEA